MKKEEDQIKIEDILKKENRMEKKHRHEENENETKKEIEAMTLHLRTRWTKKMRKEVLNYHLNLKI